jgi:hypothetical protein
VRGCEREECQLAITETTVAHGVGCIGAIPKNWRIVAILTTTASSGSESYAKVGFSRLTTHFRAVVVAVELNMAVSCRQDFAVASFRKVSGCRKASPGILSSLLCRKNALRQVKALYMASCQCKSPALRRG